MSSFDRFTADDKAVPIAAEEDGRGGVTTPTAPDELIAALLDRFLLFLVTVIATSFSFSDTAAATPAAGFVFGSAAESIIIDDGDFLVLL